MLSNLSKLMSLLSPSDKAALSALLCVSIINGLIQTLGLISIMPFIALISDPSMADNQEQLLLIKDFFNITSYQQLLIYFGVFSLLALITSNSLIILNYWASLLFFNRFGLKISSKLLNSYLHNPPQTFYKHSTSKLSKRIFSDVDRAIIGTLLAYTSILTDLFVLVVISAFLIYINPIVTMITVSALFACYGLVYLIIAKRIDRLGRHFTDNEETIHKIIKQSLTLYKEIRIARKQGFFLNRYHQSAKKLYQGATQFYTLKFIPIQIIELLVFAIILTLAGYLAISSNNTGITITTISIYAFSAYRLIPIIKNIFDSTEEILHSRSIFNALLDEIHQKEETSKQTNDSIHFSKNITLDNIRYTHPGNKTSTLNKLNINFSHGKITCIIGKSGIGKSTLLDIVIGLYPPQDGHIIIDNTYLSDHNLQSWQAKIGYVPQKIHLLEASILENIAFGESPQEIDLEQVKYAAKLAAIDELIEQQLDNGYSTLIGEGGKILSGGEAQRIGIARALYKQPELLVFDEATNELDSETESNIINNIKQQKNMTTLFVTHKQSVINHASDIINLSNTEIRKAC